MASSYSALTGIIGGTVMGDQRCVAGIFTISGVADTTAAGLSFVNFSVVTPATITSGYHYETASGVISLFSCTTGDRFNVIAWGK
jgi:hypothetical protein